jgi:hypothetical protein
MELLAIELGYSASPLQLDYGRNDRHGHMVTHCWLKTVREKLHCFKFQVQVHTVGLTPPRGEKDGWLMQRFEDVGYSLAELCRLNKVRIHQQVIFLSDVLRADGLRLDGKYLQRRPSSATWSKHKVPKEKPRSRDFMLWRAALAEIVPSHRSSEKLGGFVSPPHKRWKWRFDRDTGQLLHIK